MVLVNELKARMVLKDISVRQLAKELGISEKTVYTRFKTGVFLSTELETLIDLLEIETPDRIFFAKQVTRQETSTA